MAETRQIVYRVVTPVGPWNASTKNNVVAFSRAQFEKLYPLSTQPKDSKISVEEHCKINGIDPATYHDLLLKRLLVLGAIERDDTAIPIPVPPSPYGGLANETQLEQAIAEVKATKVLPITKEFPDAQVVQGHRKANDPFAETPGRTQKTEFGELVVAKG